MNEMSPYTICQIRGHDPQDYEITSADDGDPWSVCKWCGTQYRFVQVVQERPLDAGI